MIHLQRAKLGVASERAKEDFGDLRDVGGELVVTLELDPKHVDLLKNACGLYTRDNYAETLLNAGGATAFRSVTMRLAFVAADIPVFVFVDKRIAKHTARSIVGVWIRLKRGVRHIHGLSREIQKFPIHDEVHRPDAYTDRVWA